jgi:hypothetical protein
MLVLLAGLAILVSLTGNYLTAKLRKIKLGFKVF